MVFSIVVKVKDLFNGEILPDMSKVDKGVKFYNIVFRSEHRELIKVAFDKNYDSITVDFVEANESVASSYIVESMEATYTHLTDLDPEIFIYLYKVYVSTEVDSGVVRVGYTRRIGPYGGQDKHVAVLDVRNPTKFVGPAKKAFMARVDPEKYPPYEPMDSMRVSSVNPLSPRWYTQKAFYGSSHVTGSNELQFIDYKDIIVNFLKPHGCHEFESAKEMMIMFTSILHNGIVYKSDYRFDLPTSVDDFGDASIETSVWGDCEDMAHFYMRTIRLMLNIYPWFCSPDSNLHKYCSFFKNNYTPLVMICRIEVHGKLEYHSTLIMLPTEESGKKPFSLEVTAPNKSYDLTDEDDRKKYNDWHVSHYFLIDAQHVCRIDGPIENYTLEKFQKEALNY